MSLPTFRPDTQIAFAVRLSQIEKEHLGPALAACVSGPSIKVVNDELARLVPDDRLASLASHGLRGETLFPVPAVLAACPRLLGYYRMLFGLSQKEFYRGSAMSKFRSMEVDGRISTVAGKELEPLCANLCETAWLLLDNLPAVSLQGFRDLQLLTLGQQLKGGRLNEIGKAATQIVFQRIRAAVADSAVVAESPTRIKLTNASGRQVVVEFSSDPDIAVSESLTTSTAYRLAIEIKGGTDVSNIHNRLGEAEKSHQKAKSKGFPEFWTIVNSPVSGKLARQESPTTNLFFDMTKIIDPDDPEWVRFRDEFTSRLGIPHAE